MEGRLNKSRVDYVALSLMALAVAIWGFGWVIMKAVVPFIGPFDLVVLRYALGFLTLLVIVLATKRPLAFPPFWFTVGIAAFQTTAYQCLVQMALIAGGTGRVVMVAYTMPFWVALFAWIMLADRPAARHWVGFAFAALGLFAVVSPWQGLGGVGSTLLALAGGIAWALGTVFSKMMFQRHQPDVLSLTMWLLLLGALMALPFTWLMPQPAIVWTPDLVLGIAYLGVFASAAAWALWMFVVQRVAPTVAAMSGLGVPVTAIVLAWALLNERPTTIEWVGIVLILVGLVVVTLAPGRR